MNVDPSASERVPIATAPNGWYFSQKLKIGFSFFNRLFVNASFLLCADLVGLMLSFETASLTDNFFLGKDLSPTWAILLAGFWTAGALTWGLLPGWGMSPVESLRRQVTLCGGVLIVSSITLMLSNAADQFSWFSVVATFCMAIVLIPFIRMLAKRLLIRVGLWGMPVAIYGGGSAGKHLIERLQAEPGQGYYPVCVFDDDDNLQNKTISGVPVRGKADSIVHNVPIAILAMTKISSERLSELMEGPLASFLRVIIIPNLIHTPSLWATSRDLSGVPGLEMKNNLLDPSLRILKRCFEVGVTWATLPAWGPLYCLLYCIIWLDDRSNPIYKQKRIGQGGEEFEAWKFRTMVPNADQVLERCLANDPALRIEWEANCKLQKDPRITRIGNFLRKTSLDEIPQLINVLRAEMSLIGPRPLPDYHYARLPLSVRRLRERVRPGMTGLWQVSGRSDAGDEGMVRWDPYYVRNWSLWLDIVILVRTLRVVIAGSGAR